MADHLDHFSAMNTFIKSADYLTKPVKKRASSNAFGMSRRKDYTSEEKLFFVNLVVEGGNSKASVAKQYDIPESTLRGWCKPKHKVKLEKEAQERKTAPNVFDTPSPSSSSSSAGSGVTPSVLYHQFKDSPYDHHPSMSSSGVVPTLQIPKVESLYYPQQAALRCSDPRPLIKEERDEEVLNLSNKTEHHMSSPILTQCLNNVPTSVSESPSNSIKSMQHMKHALLDMKSPNNLIDIHQNISTMFQSYAKSPHPPFSADLSCKLSPKPSNSPSPVQYHQPEKPDEVNVNKRKYEAFVNDVNKDVNSRSTATPLDLYRKESQANNNNSEFYKNYEQFLNNKRTSDLQKEFSSPSSKPEPPASPVNHYFKNYLESMVKAQQQKLPGTPAAPEQFKLAAQQLWLQQLALNQLAATQLPNAMQHQQTAAALQQQQLLYERQLLNSRLNQQAVAGGNATNALHPEEKLYTWTSQLHANQRELEDKLKLLIQTQQQILKDKSQSPPEPQNLASASDSERVKRLRTMNVRDILENHRQSLEKSHQDAMELRGRPSEDSDISDRSQDDLNRSEETLLRLSEERPSDLSRMNEEEMCVETIEEDAVKDTLGTLDLSKGESHKRLISPRDFCRNPPAVRESPLSRLPPESPKPNVNMNGYRSNELDAPYNLNTEETHSPYHVEDSTHNGHSYEEEAKPVQLDHDENHLDIAIHHGEQFLEDLEKVSHPKLTLQHIRQLRDLLCKLKTPVFENNNMKEALDESNKSKRKSLLNIVHNLTN